MSRIRTVVVFSSLVFLQIGATFVAWSLQPANMASAPATPSWWQSHAFSLLSFPVLALLPEDIVTSFFFPTLLLNAVAWAFPLTAVIARASRARPRGTQ
jgi:hypothetical protein